MRAAAVRAGKVGAAASFHGGGLYTDAPTSPHLVLPRIRAELYFGHAINDQSMPEEAIKNLEQALGRCEESIRARPTRALITAGPRRIRPSTTSSRPTGPLKN